MAAVKPMIQQPGGAKPNSSYNNNNGRTAAPSMQQEQSIKQVRDRNTMFLFIVLKKRIQSRMRFIKHILTHYDCTVRNTDSLKDKK